MERIGVAVVGAGFMGPVHVEALRRVGVKVVGILGLTDAESRRAAETLSLQRFYRSYDELLADDAVDSVHLAVPNQLHFAMAKAALLAGKHVMCEKPLAMNTTESAELVRLSRERPHQFAGVNYNVRYYPLCLEARELCRRGDLGEVFHVCGSYTQDWLLLETDYNWRVLVDEGGALRAVADIGTHWLDLVHAITGLEVAAVCADLKTVHPVRRRPVGEVETFKGKEGSPSETRPVDITTEDYGSILLRFRGEGLESGARGSLWVSQVTAGRKNCLRFEIAGSKGALSWNSESPNELWIGRREAANEVLLRDPSLVSPATVPAIDYPGGHNEGYPDSFKQCFRAFYRSITTGDSPSPPEYPTFLDGHREVALCEAVLESHRQGRWAEVKGVES